MIPSSSNEFPKWEYTPSYPTIPVPIYPQYLIQRPSPCQGCSNNPMFNPHATGFCLCTLGNQIWY